jgi:multicomponent Na+:H+ antiporter subunit F
MNLNAELTTIVLYLTYAGLIVAAICGAIRLLKGESLADRIIALDVVLISLMAGVAVRAAVAKSGVGLDLLVVVAIVGFTAAVAATRFVEYDTARRLGSDSTTGSEAGTDSGRTTS